MPFLDGDVVIMRLPDNCYRIRIAGGEVFPELYATFAAAAMQGEALVVARKSRLFLQDSAVGQPQLLLDARSR